MKSLFEDSELEEYTEDAHELSKEHFAAIIPIIKKYSDMGYSLRDIQYGRECNGRVPYGFAW